MNDLQRHIQPILTAGLDVSDRPSGGLKERLSGASHRLHTRIVPAPIDLQNESEIGESEVGIVGTEGSLLPVGDAQRSQQVGKPTLVIADAEPSRLARLRALLACSHRVNGTPPRRLGDLDALPQLRPFLVSAQGGLRTGTHYEAPAPPRGVEAPAANPRLFGERHPGFASQVAGVQGGIVQVQSAASSVHAAIVPDWRVY